MLCFGIAHLSRSKMCKSLRQCGQLGLKRLYFTIYGPAISMKSWPLAKSKEIMVGPWTFTGKFLAVHPLSRNCAKQAYCTIYGPAISMKVDLLGQNLMKSLMRLEDSQILVEICPPIIQECANCAFSPYMASPFPYKLTFSSQNLMKSSTCLGGSIVKFVWKFTQQFPLIVLKRAEWKHRHTYRRKTWKH